MLAGPEAVAHHRVLTDADQAAGLADADPFGDVSQDVDNLGFGQSAVEQRRALAFGEVVLAGAAIQQAALVAAVAQTHGQVAMTALAVVGALVVLAAEVAQVVHDAPSVAAARDRACPGRLGILQKRPKAFNTERTRPNSEPSREMVS
jgi:hypothetical protein